MANGRVVTVECRCGHPLFRYYKGGRGRLIKCFLDEIRTDYVGIHRLGPAGTRGRQGPEAPPICPACGRTLGSIQIVRGRPALKINHGTIKEIRI